MRRLDEDVGIDVALSGWDSEMIEYAFLHKCAMGEFMLYNGNGFGKTGLGIARRCDD